MFTYVSICPHFTLFTAGPPSCEATYDVEMHNTPLVCRPRAYDHRTVEHTLINRSFSKDTLNRVPRRLMERRKE